MKCRIFFFHSLGTIWRTGAFDQFAGFGRPKGTVEPLAEVLRQTQGAFATVALAATF
jgi:hypothetical protein